MFDDIAGPPGAERGVLLLHGGGGRGVHERERGERLRALGFAVYAPDLFREILAAGATGAPGSDRARARAAIGALARDAAELRRRVRSAWQKLAGRVHRTYAVGHCFGGLAALELARSGADVEAVVSLHGSLSTSVPAERGQVRARVLACCGAEDPFCPRSERATFEDELSAAGADWQLQVFAGAQHGFSVPSVSGPGCAYDELADRRSWRALVSLFDEPPRSR
ncbi:MAG TPA: dienelactone hydrolase family protein [Polyangiaceae bacterium]|nr:dienelactone hydrolase family protein [Polyangiaceae bacterium]